MFRKVLDPRHHGDQLSPPHPCDRVRVVSDESGGTDWWIASDGKWYPPETHPDFQPATSLAPPLSEPILLPPPRNEPTLPPQQVPAVAPGTSATPPGGQGKKPVWRRWWAIALGVLVVIVGLAQFADSPEDDEANNFVATDTTTPVTDTAEVTDTTNGVTETSTPAAASVAPPTIPPETSVETQPTEVPPSEFPLAATNAEAQLLGLVVAEPDPQRSPYIRDEYDGDGWADFDGDCISTRHELLIVYSLDEPALSDGCFVDTGRWIDPYTGNEYSDASDVTIDHVVPLAEAHRSGAWRWDSDTKNRFANDETPGHLLVVDGDVNQSKADSTPDKWMPPASEAHCQYAIDWIGAKTRYDLTVTAPEQAALADALATCSNSSTVRPFVEAAVPIVVVTIPTTTTTTTIAPSAGPGVVVLLACDKRNEVVTIGNTGGETVSLSGYTLHDEGDKHRTSLGGFGSLAPGEQLRILTGPDASSGAGQVVWKNQNVWNNDGDVANLIAPDGTVTTERC